MTDPKKPTFSEAAKDLLQQRVQARFDLMMMQMRAQRAATCVALGQGQRLAAGIGNITPSGIDTGLPLGVNLVGFLQGDLGLGVHVRGVARAMEQYRIPIAGLDFSFDLRSNRGDHSCDHLIRTQPEYRANIYCLNADTLMYCHELSPALFKNRYNIQYGAWELAHYPPSWMPAMNLTQEIWTISTFIQQSVAASASVPVLYMGLPVECPAFEPLSRQALGLPEKPFLFLFSYDINSMTERKNPDAVLQAFQEAFPHNPDVGLVIKINFIPCRANHEERIRLLKEQWAHDTRITFMDAIIPYTHMLALIDSCNAYVSLHRAEGFGLGMAEAMYLGKPVIATDYSGNTDFTRHGNSCPVEYTLVPVPRGHYVLWEGQVWAEPDISHAAYYMRQLFSDQALCEKLGRAAGKTMREEFSLEAIGGKIQRRLRLLGLIP